MDFDAADVAKQLTILDADYFFRVDIPEMLFWAKDHDEEKCPQLTLFTTHFNNVSQWWVWLQERVVGVAIVRGGVVGVVMREGCGVKRLVTHVQVQSMY